MENSLISHEIYIFWKYIDMFAHKTRVSKKSIFRKYVQLYLNMSYAKFEGDLSSR